MDFLKNHSWAVWGLVSLLLLALILVFGLGAAVGASGSHDSFVNTIIPLLSMIGSWLSGLGALAAALVSLYLANRATREDVEDCELSFDWEYGFLKIEVVATGKRPVTITGAGLQTPDMYCPFYIDEARCQPKIPATLNYGQKLSLVLHHKDTFVNLSHFFEAKEVNENTEVHLYVKSTMYDYVELLKSSDVKDLIDEASAYRR